MFVQQVQDLLSVGGVFVHSCDEIILEIHLEFVMLFSTLAEENVGEAMLFRLLTGPELLVQLESIVGLVWTQLGCCPFP